MGRHRIDLDEEQETALRLTTRLWPSETLEQAALALTEEVGEVARAIIKRTHEAFGEGDRELADWTGNLRTELAQVVIVVMKMAQVEGFSLWDAIADELVVLERRAESVDA